MTTQNPEKASSGVLQTLAAVVIVIAGMKTAQALLVPFLLAIFIAIICAGPMHWLQQRKVPAGLAVLLVIAGVMLAGGLVLTLLGTSVNDFTRDLPIYQEKLRGQTVALLDYLDRFGVQVSKELLLEHFDPGAVMQYSASMLAKAGGVLTNSFLILLTVIFILFEAAGMPNKLRAALPDAENSLHSFERFAVGVRQYLVIKTLVSFATGLVVATGLSLLGVDYPLLWGLLAFLLNYVPNIGSIIAAIPAVLLTSVQLGLLQALIVVAIYLSVNLIMGNAVEPKLMGRKLNLSSLMVFISLVFWGWILGPVGMLLSVPLTMIVKIALEQSDTTRWLAILLSSDVSSATDAKR